MDKLTNGSSKIMQEKFNILLDIVNQKLNKYNCEITTDKLGLSDTSGKFNIVMIDERELAKTIACGYIDESYEYLKIMSYML